jgi:SAM-dependent methyltransferase
MTYRAIELLALPLDQPLFLLDIGCGSGLSGEILDELGHIWAGVDIAPSMLREWPLFFRSHSLILRKRSLWRGKSRVICFCMTLAKGLVSGQAHSTVQ